MISLAITFISHIKKQFYNLLFIVIILLSSCSSKKSEDKYDLVVSNINLIDGTGNPLIEHANVYISDGRIKKINSGKQKHQADSIIDGTGKFLIPGLFDNHFHLGTNYNRRLKIMMHFGITNVFSVGGTYQTYENMKRLDSLEQVDAIISPTIKYSSPFVTIPGGHPRENITGQDEGVNIYHLTSADQIQAIAKEAKENGAIAIKLMIEDGPEPPFIERIRPKWIQIIREEADKNELMLVTHISDPVEFKLSVDNSVDAIMHSPYPPLDFEKDSALIKKILNDSISLVTTGNMRAGIDYPMHPEKLKSKYLSVFDEELASINETFEQDKQIAEMTITQFFKLDLDTYEKYIDYPKESNFRKLDSIGVNIVVGTDAGLPKYNLPGISVHEEMQLYQNGGMEPVRIIKCATLNAAKMLKIEEDYGSVEEEKFANFIILKSNPLEDISNTLTIESVYKRGKKQIRITNANNM